MRLPWVPAVLLGCVPVPVPDTDPADSGEDCAYRVHCETGLCWVNVCGGAYAMGAVDGVGDADEGPQRRVTVPTLEVLRTEVTVAQHRACADAGGCAPIEALDPLPDMCADQGDDDAQGCLDWYAADAYCAWVGGRLPSEAEWEYAARSRGDARPFPWGAAEPTCELAVLGYIDQPERNCGEVGAAPVCSRPAGDTDQGLCDMAGNIYEWVADWYSDPYDASLVQGEANMEPGPWRVLRGGGLSSDEPVRVTNRTYHEPEFLYSGSGVRCVRDL